MNKVDHISALVEESDGLAQEDHKEEVIKDVGLNRKEEEEEEEEEDDEEDEEDEVREKDEDEHQEEEDDKTGETVYGIQEKEEGEEEKVEHISLLELDEAEKEVVEEIELNVDDDDDDDDEDFEKVEELTLPVASKWDLPGYDTPIYGVEVPVLKDDEFIHDSLYRNDIDMDDIDDDAPLPPHVFDPVPPPPAPDCSICYKQWTPLHHFCSLPCGHIFGFQCIEKWIQPGFVGTCPQCNDLCSLEDVRRLYKTPICIPAADKGVADPEMSTRRFSYTKQGMVSFRKLESGRRNFALKKRSDAKKRLAGVVGRKKDLMKRRDYLLDRRASVLNRAKALEKRGGSLCRVDALRLRADALGRWADEYLRRAKACEERAKALGQRARAYNQRVKAFEARLLYFQSKPRQP